MDNWVLRKTETDIIDEKGSMEEQLLKSALGRKRAACSEDFFHIYAYGGAHVHSTLSYPYCVLFSENLASSVLYKEIFSREIPLTAPDRPSAQSLVRRGRKIKLICKAKLCGKTFTTGNQLIQASSAAFIVGFFSTNHKWDGTNVFLCVNWPSACFSILVSTEPLRKGKRKVDLGWEPQRGLLKPSNGNRTAQKKVFCTLWPLVGQAA